MLKSLLNGHWMNSRIERICLDASQNIVSDFFIYYKGQQHSNTATPFENLTPQKELMLQTVFQIRNQIRIFLSLLDPDPLFLCTGPDPSKNKQKNEEKPRFLFCDFFMTFYL